MAESFVEAAKQGSNCFQVVVKVSSFRRKENRKQNGPHRRRGNRDLGYLCDKLFDQRYSCHAIPNMAGVTQRQQSSAVVSGQEGRQTTKKWFSSNLEFRSRSSRRLNGERTSCGLTHCRAPVFYMTECGVPIFLSRHPSRDEEQNVNASEFVEDIMTFQITVVEKESVSYEENTGQGLICHRFTSSSPRDIISPIVF